MSFDLETLYALLPAIYRVRDADAGESLKSLLAVIAEQVAILEEDLDQLYDDQFIETCAEWVVPYIGDLVGARGVHEVTPSTFSQRAQVANTLAYRRRKGTAAVLEQLARDVTGWDASGVEYFQRLVTTQHMNHVRPGSRLPNLRRWEPLERLNTPFDRLAHTVDVRRIASRHGKYNIPNVGLFLWRLRAYSLTNSPAFRVDAHRYMFSPLGNNLQLFNRPETEDQITHLAEPINVPMPIGRHVLGEYLDDYYGQGKSLWLAVDDAVIDSDDIQVCDLSDTGPDSAASPWAHKPTKKIAIDPVCGRIALPEDARSVQVSFHHGFSADLGGGEYGRGHSFSAGAAHEVEVPSPHTRVQEALDELDHVLDESAAQRDDQASKKHGLVEIKDSGRYEEALAVDVAPNSHVELRAADGRRPTLILGGELVISGDTGAEVTLNGLVISGGRLRVSGRVRRLRLQHCTLVPGLGLARDGTPQQPGEPGLVIESVETRIEIDHCIIGGLRAADGTRIQITNSIVDATSESRVAYAAPDGASPGGTLEHVENCTIIGGVHSTQMDYVTNTIFLARLADDDAWTAPIRVVKRQQGCVRFSYLPLDSQVPRRYYCQPQSDDEAGRVRPQFTSLRYGNVGYCQLSRNCPGEIWQGADDEAEMGAFHDLFQPQREINLRVCLDEYLRFGLEAGIFYAT
jgi:hypothetical protein